MRVAVCRVDWKQQQLQREEADERVDDSEGRGQRQGCGKGRPVSLIQQGQSESRDSRRSKWSKTRNRATECS